MLVTLLVLLSTPLWVGRVGLYQYLALEIMIWVLFAMGYNLLLGFTGLPSFGHGAFFGTGAYAFGLLQLKSIDAVIQKRAQIDQFYREALNNIAGIRCVDDSGETRRNYSYFPILVQQDFPVSRDTLFNTLRSHDIYARRYFYPLITDFPMYRGLPTATSANLPIATRIAQQVICLPIYPDLPQTDAQRIVDIIKDAAQHS